MNKSRALATISIVFLVIVLALDGETVLANQQDHESGHDGHGEHADKLDEEVHGEHGDEHDDEGAVSLSAQDLEEFGISVEPVSEGKLRYEITLPGEVKINEDRLAHVVPRLSGVVAEVYKTLGDTVHKGEVMALLDSRELATIKATYLAARERLSLAQSTFKREEDLREKKISAEKEYLTAKHTLAEAQIELRTAVQQLRALGFSDSYVSRLESQSESPLTRYEIIVPLDGTIIEKHAVLGEVVKDDTEIFVIADLSTVWVDLSVYQKDLSSVRKGQEVVISTGPGSAQAKGRIAYIGPVIGASTRTALARIVLPNPDGQWRPGSFITAQVATDEFEVHVRVPRAAFQTVKGLVSVFVETPEGLIARPVTVGRTDATHTEVTSGLEPGERIATSGTLLLKAELGKAAFSEGHAH